ncbi:YlbF family regulator [Enterococcus sp. CSURQ0835]|uniref:YlbF family regulator n=1 Tax=Enterococcus sp. CSURQ0835 TaxID=2681394 RepID=UPI001F440037|nr:YlbF family regulator [Enterococcus sp. CSURQ0835]
MDKEIQAALTKLTAALANNELIKNYQQVKRQVDQSEKLAQLQTAIKNAQQEAVQAEHYEKPAAKKQALQQADALKEAFDTHPLVGNYRAQLLEADDLLQYVTNLIQQEINDAIKEDTNASKN